MAVWCKCGHHEREHDGWRPYGNDFGLGECNHAEIDNEQAIFCSCKKFAAQPAFTLSKPKPKAKKSPSVSEIMATAPKLPKAPVMPQAEPSVSDRMRLVLEDAFPSPEPEPKGAFTTVAKQRELCVTRDGMLVCNRHAVEAKLAVARQEFLAEGDTKFRIRPSARTWSQELNDGEFWCLDQGCVMCLTAPFPGRRCEHCYERLHERWPAAYCSNACALEDV